MTKILSFPKKTTRSNPLPDSAHEAKMRLEDMQHVFMIDVLQVALETLCNQLALAGFEVLDEEKNFAMMVESLKSVMSKTVGIYHPFQDIAEQVMGDPDEDGIMEIADGVNVTFDKPHIMKEEENEVQPEASEPGL
jgi:hypothetical protein